MKLRRMISLLGVLFVLLLACAGSCIPGIVFEGRERRLFAEQGTMEAQTPVLPWEEQGESEGDTRNRLGTERMEQVLRIWQESDGEILHEPVEGQLSMEEAFEAGREWADAMRAAGCFPSDGAVPGQGSADGDYASAVLGMAAGHKGEVLPKESYYSFWHVRFYNEDNSLWLRVNAVTGKVWEAELILYAGKWNPPEDFAYESLVKFLELSGTENPVAGYVEQEEGAVLYLADTTVYAQMKCEDEERIYVWSQEGGTKEERRCMRISYRLGVIG